MLNKGLSEQRQTWCDITGSASERRQPGTIMLSRRQARASTGERDGRTVEKPGTGRLLYLLASSCLEHREGHGPPLMLSCAQRARW